MGYTYTLTSADGNKTTGDNTRVDATCNIVNVVSTHNNGLPSTQMSPNEQDWYDLARVSSDNRGSALRSLVAVPFAVDQGAAMMLIRQNISNIFSEVYDEAVVLRAMLLWMTYMPGDLFTERSTSTTLLYGFYYSTVARCVTGAALLNMCRSKSNKLTSVVI